MITAPAPAGPSPLTLAVVAFALVISLAGNLLLLRSGRDLGHVSKEPSAGTRAQPAVERGVASRDTLAPAAVGGDPNRDRSSSCAELGRAREAAAAWQREVAWRLPHMEQYQLGTRNLETEKRLLASFKALSWRARPELGPVTECRAYVCRAVFPPERRPADYERWRVDVGHLINSLDTFEPLGPGVASEEDLETMTTQGTVVYFRVPPSREADGIARIQQLLIQARDGGTIRTCERSTGGRYRRGTLMAKVDNMGMGPVFTFGLREVNRQPRIPDAVDRCILWAFQQAALSLNAPANTTRARSNILLVPGPGR
jgi:hypothetical protein